MGCPIALDTSQWRYSSPFPLWFLATRFARSTFSFLLRSAETRRVEGRMARHRCRTGEIGWPGEKTRSNQGNGKRRVCFTIACALAGDNSRVSSGGSTAATSIPVTKHRFHAPSSLFSSFFPLEISRWPTSPAFSPRRRKRGHQKMACYFVFVRDFSNTFNSNYRSNRLVFVKKETTWNYNES